ncbi:nucleotidyltransferase family protein [Paludibacter sp. 221]|uniref:nucleotidyltransferase family protein n=1 Tax=Paludibacter sp. 221 TaxID=2302939 RepID=UPI0013D70FC5|nr:nucleotidyltransferase family protein [Paludibacter sp. 221]NDV47103.1 nucleotidyltransferase family protein [Paludibacter sp. 221]
MKAMIFAAGLGTRLKPLTDSTPKALIPVAGKPLLEHVILKLKSAGFDEIIINVHHFPDMIIEFLKQNRNFGIRIEISDERDMLLDTGGGIRKAARFFDDGKPFLIHNVDILSNINLKDLYNNHVSSDSLATLVVSKRDTFRYLLFDEENRLKAWTNEKTGEVKPSSVKDISMYNKLAFSGIQVLSPAVFDLMKNCPEKFPIMDFYLSNAESQKISGYIPCHYQMLDVGKLEVLDAADEFARRNT